jgi:hypothetical protein
MNDYSGLGGTTPIAPIADSRLRVRRKGNTGDRQRRGREEYQRGKEENKREERASSGHENEKQPDYGLSRTRKRFGKKIDVVI